MLPCNNVQTQGNPSHLWQAVPAHQLEPSQSNLLSSVHTLDRPQMQDCVQDDKVKQEANTNIILKIVDSTIFPAAHYLVKQNTNTFNGFRAKPHLMATAPRAEAGGGNKWLYCTNFFTTTKGLFYMLTPNQENKKSWHKKEKKANQKTPPWNTLTLAHNLVYKCN